MIFYLKQFLFAFLSALGFSILFNIPKNAIIKASICGTIGWAISTASGDFLGSSTAGTLLGALAVGILGETFAKWYKEPATIFIIPGVLPLVPGAGMYYTMLKVIEKDFSSAINYGFQTAATAFSIAIAIIIASSFNRIFTKALSRFSKNKEIIKRK